MPNRFDLPLAPLERTSRPVLCPLSGPVSLSEHHLTASSGGSRRSMTAGRIGRRRIERLTASCGRTSTWTPSISIMGARRGRRTAGWICKRCSTRCSPLQDQPHPVLHSDRGVEAIGRAPTGPSASVPARSADDPEPLDPPRASTRPEPSSSLRRHRRRRGRRPLGCCEPRRRART